MEKGNLTDIDDSYYAYSGRLISKDEIDQGLEEIIRRESRFEKLKKVKNYFIRGIGQSYEKFVLYVLKGIMLKEMQSDYYQDFSHVREFIDIDTHLVKDSEGNVKYRNVENLCIWQNGFYNFNSFNMTTPGMSGRRKHSRNNFNEEMFDELRELNIGGKLYEIPLEDQGSPRDYADLESKIKVLSRQHESYTE